MATGSCKWCTEILKQCIPTALIQFTELTSTNIINLAASREHYHYLQAAQVLTIRDAEKSRLYIF